MKYDMTRPCNLCPFLKTSRCCSKKRLEEFASGAFACHKTAELVEDDEIGSEFHATPDSQHRAGALIYLEKRERSHNMMRIMERLSLYDHTKLDMKVAVK